MSLQQRIKKIEVAAEPLVKEATRERRRRNLGKFGMCDLFCYGFTHEEALVVLARSVKKAGTKNLDAMPNFTAPSNFEFFQSFLDDDAEAARIYSEIIANRVEGIGFEETLKDEQLNEKVAAIVHQLKKRLEAYFSEHHRSDYLNYRAAVEEGKRLLEAKNG